MVIPQEQLDLLHNGMPKELTRKARESGMIDPKLRGKVGKILILKNWLPNLQVEMEDGNGKKYYMDLQKDLMHLTSQQV